MSQTVLSANNTSTVQNTLTSNGSKAHSLAYATDESFPNVSKKFVSLPPYSGFTGVMNGNTETFNLPMSNICYALRLRNFFTTTLAVAAGAGADAVAAENTFLIGLNIIKNIELTCGSQPVGTLSGEAIKALILNNTSSFQDFCSVHSAPLTIGEETTAGTGAVACTTAVPILFSWFMAREKALDLGTFQQFQLIVTYKSRIEAGMSTDCVTTGSKLDVYSYLPDSRELEKMRVLNMQNPRMEAFNTITERHQMVTSFATAQTFTSSCTNSVYKTHIFIAKNNVDGTVPVYGCPRVAVGTVSVEIGGEVFYNSQPKSVFAYEQVMNGMESGLDSYDCVTIDWSLLAKRDSNSGLLAMSGMDKVIFTVKAETIAALKTGETIGSYYIYFCHEYWCVLQKDENKFLSIVASH